MRPASTLMLKCGGYFVKSNVLSSKLARENGGLEMNACSSGVRPRSQAMTRAAGSNCEMVQSRDCSGRKWLLLAPVTIVSFKFQVSGFEFRVWAGLHVHQQAGSW